MQCGDSGCIEKSDLIERVLLCMSSQGVWSQSVSLPESSCVHVCVCVCYSTGQTGGSNPRTKELIPLPCAGWKGKPLYRPKPEHDRSQDDQKPSFDAQKPAQEETEVDVCKICYDREINCVFLYVLLLSTHALACVVLFFLWGTLTLLHLLLPQRVWPFVLVRRYDSPTCLVLVAPSWGYLSWLMMMLACVITQIPASIVFNTPAECGRQMKDCPICRRPIARVVEIFKS